MTQVVPSLPCYDQDAHYDALFDSRELKLVPSGLVVAIALHRAMRTDRFDDETPERPFGEPLARRIDAIAADVGVGRQTASRALREIVRLGFFDRDDEGHGGRAEGPARWVPTIPAGEVQ